MTFSEAGGPDVLTLNEIDRPVRVWSVRDAAATAPPAAAAAATPARPSIAVLPFVNMSGDPEQDYFGDGIAEDIITDLSKISALFVLSRNGSFAHRGQAVDSRTDQFSFCAALYEALFGRLPFAGESMAEQAANVLGGRVLTPADDTLVPLSIRHALQRGLSVQPEDRFPSMAELLTALHADSELDPTAARASRRGLTLTITIGTMLLVMATVIKFARGGITVRMMVMIAAAIVALLLGASILFRRKLLQHAFHRKVVHLLLINTTVWFAVRCLGLALHVQLSQMIPIDLMVVGGLYASIAYEYLPGVWWFAGGAMAGAILSVLRPQNAEQIYLAVYISVSFIVSLAWERVATQRKGQTSTAQTSTDIPSS